MVLEEWRFLGSGKFRKTGFAKPEREGRRRLQVEMVMEFLGDGVVDKGKSGPIPAAFSIRNTPAHLADAGEPFIVLGREKLEVQDSREGQFFCALQAESSKAEINGDRVAVDDVHRLAVGVAAGELLPFLLP